MEEYIIGKPCNNFDSQFLSDNPKLPTKDVDDHLLCGKAIFSNTTNQFVEYEWLGYCQRVVHLIFHVLQSGFMCCLHFLGTANRYFALIFFKRVTNRATNFLDRNS